MKWSRAYDEDVKTTRDSREWDEIWNVLEYTPTLGYPADIELLNAKPE